MEKKPKTYGETVAADAYTEELQFHQYIPQADAMIFDEIRKKSLEAQRPIRVLDLGMGPGRLTSKMATIVGVSVVGIDNSPEFVAAAKNKPHPSVEYVCADFLNYESTDSFDVIFMQGVWHHVSQEVRPKWLNKIERLLKKDGLLIVGDEFIPDYSSENEREHRVGLFYLHIIGEALKAQNSGLARNECLNFLADTLHQDETRGCFDDALLEYIGAEAAKMNEALFTLDSDKRLSGDATALRMVEILTEVRRRSRVLSMTPGAQWIDRGDYKVSVSVIDDEFSPNFERNNRRDSGPVDYVGGMSVLTYRKQNVN